MQVCSLGSHAHAGLPSCLMAAGQEPPSLPAAGAAAAFLPTALPELLPVLLLPEGPLDMDDIGEGGSPKPPAAGPVNISKQLQLQ